VHGSHESECLRPPLIPLAMFQGWEPTELNQSRFLFVHREAGLRYALPKIRQYPTCILRA
jgi:hypothetical protein